MSSLTWLDYSERERRQVMEVIELFRDEGTRDELGIGAIRDALADLMFPGTSTVQTRLRYFLFIPWLMQGLEIRKVASNDAERRSRQFQGRLCEALLRGESQEGVIGAVAGQHVQRLPSNVYWNGLGVWGIRLYPGSEAAYYQSLDGFYEQQRRNRGSAGGEPGKDGDLMNWDPALPESPDDLLHDVGFDLTDVEADYLADRIRRHAGDSLFRVLMDRQALVDKTHAFAWEHPETTDLPPALADTLEHARNFSEMMHGAALLYNLILAEKANLEDYVARYVDLLSLWWDTTVARADAFAQWDRQAFWDLLKDAGARVTPHTQSFVDRWRDCFETADRIEALTSNARVRELIIHREQRLKGKRARATNPRMLETWGGASGTNQLDYRWNRPVKVYLNDLVAVL